MQTRRNWLKVAVGWIDPFAAQRIHTTAENDYAYAWLPSTAQPVHPLQLDTSVVHGFWCHIACSALRLTEERLDEDISWFTRP